jgi:vacuolar-type H+-ATPase subunit B/Vma2
MKEYRTITQIAGPLLFVEKTEPIGYGELVNIVLYNGTIKRGQVLDTSDEVVVVQVFESTAGIGRDSGVRFTGETIKMPVGREMLGRILSGGGKPIDSGPEIVPEKRLDITGRSHQSRQLRRSPVEPQGRDGRDQHHDPGASRRQHVYSMDINFTAWWQN